MLKTKMITFARLTYLFIRAVSLAPVMLLGKAAKPFKRLENWWVKITHKPDDWLIKQLQ